jgi:hypothetical protein
MPFDTPAQHFIFSTVRIEASGPSGISTGTAFRFNHVLEKGIATFFVTNKHVIEGATDGMFFFTRAAGERPEHGPELGNRINITVSNFARGWQGHPDPKVHIAVMSTGGIMTDLIAYGDRPYFRPLHSGMLPTNEQLRATDAILHRLPERHLR